MVCAVQPENEFAADVIYLLRSCVDYCPHFCCCACRCGAYVQGLQVWAHDPCDACHVTERVQDCSQHHHAP